MPSAGAPPLMFPFEKVTGAFFGDAQDRFFQPQVGSAEEELRLVRWSASILEALLLSACAFEDLPEGAPVPTDRFLQAFEHAVARTGIDVGRLARDLVGVFGQPPLPGSVTPPRVQQVVRVLRAALDLTPADDLYDRATSLHVPDEGHRIVTAVEGLRSYIRRHDGGQNDAVKLLARKYADSVLSIEEAAVLLQIPKHDVVHLFDELGAARPLSTFDPEARRRLLHAVRQDRKSMSGAVDFRTDRLVRDVLSSERIEGIDARPWISRGSSSASRD
jgi:hypothetical protein